MHDVQLEDRLRQALRTEAEALPFTITADELHRRLDERRRDRINLTGILSAAAAIVIVAGIGAVLLADRGQTPPVGTSPSPAPSSTPARSADSGLANVATFAAIRQAIGVEEPVLLQGEDAGDPTISNDLPRTFDVGVVPDAGFHDVAFHCVGRGPFSVGWADPRTGENLGSMEQPSCPEHVEVFTTDQLPAGARLQVRASAQIAWRVVAFTPVPDNAPPMATLPTLEHAMLIAETSVLGEATDELVVRVPDDAEHVSIVAACAGVGSIRIFDGTLRHAADCTAEGTAATVWSAVPPASLELTIEVENVGPVNSAVAAYAYTLGSDPATRFIPPHARVSGGGETATAVLGCGMSFELADGTNAVDDCAPVHPVIPADRAIHVPAGTELTLSIPGWRLTGLTGELVSSAELIEAEGFGVTFASLVDMDGGSDTVTFAAPQAGDWTLKLGISATRDGDRYSVPYLVRVVVEP
jgi:hypothetical protein